MNCANFVYSADDRTAPLTSPRLKALAYPRLYRQRVCHPSSPNSPPIAPITLSASSTDRTTTICPRHVSQNSASSSVNTPPRAFTSSKKFSPRNPTTRSHGVCWRTTVAPARGRRPGLGAPGASPSRDLRRRQRLHPGVERHDDQRLIRIAPLPHPRRLSQRISSTSPLRSPSSRCPLPLPLQNPLELHTTMESLTSFFT